MAISDDEEEKKNDARPARIYENPLRSGGDENRLAADESRMALSESEASGEDPEGEQEIDPNEPEPSESSHVTSAAVSKGLKKDIFISYHKYCMSKSLLGN